jgi:hypothetical protein
MNSPYQTLALDFVITGHKANIYIKLLQSLCSYYLSSMVTYLCMAIALNTAERNSLYISQHPFG